MNGNEDIERLIARISRLTEREISDLTVAWYSAERAAEQAVGDAERAAWEAVRNAGRSDTLDAIWAAWSSSWAISNDRRGVWNAAWNAVLAREVKDLISEEHFNALYGPWRSVMER